MFVFFQLKKKLLEGYQPGLSIPRFAMKVEEISPRQSLEEKVYFKGVDEDEFLTIGMNNYTLLTM